MSLPCPPHVHADAADHRVPLRCWQWSPVLKISWHLFSMMGSTSILADRLHFDRGLRFQDEVCQMFRSPVHHPSPNPNGSFFLLVTFHHFLFRLTEDLVGLALQSCLGGHALDFHAKFLSTNNFYILVFCKEVGFFIYRLRHVTTDSFNLYFHLWNNGTPHWNGKKKGPQSCPIMLNKTKRKGRNSKEFILPTLWLILRQRH